MFFFAVLTAVSRRFPTLIGNFVRQRYLFVGGATFTSLATAAYLLSDKRARRKAKISISGVGRFIRSLGIGLAISVDYKITAILYDESSSNYIEKMSACHERSARRILNGCLANGGLYIKLGQGLGAFSNILPPEYPRILQVLLDKALTRKLNEIDEIFKEEFSRPPTDIFAKFDYTPIAAASLAEVHKATTQDGNEVAVKVQYIDLQDRYTGDIWTCELLMDIVELVFPQFGFGWILKDLKFTLAQELDFVNEGLNSERAYSELKPHLPYVYVPEVFWELTSRRILTTEFINGCSIRDGDGIRSMGLSIAEVNRQLIECFAWQIFRTGFVHADPHPGNILVRKDKSGKPELVLIDHGLYETVPESVRLNLCHFYAAVVSNDSKKMKQYSTAMGVDDWKLFAEMLLQRPLSSRIGLYLSNFVTPMEANEMKRVAQEHFDQIMVVLQQMPRNLLLVLRNLNIVRSINRLYGYPVDRFSTMARIAIAGSISKPSGRNILLMMKYWTVRLRFDVMLLFDRLYRRAFSVFLKVFDYFVLEGKLSKMEKTMEQYRVPV